MHKFYDWLDRNKEKDLLRVQICKIIYSIEIATVPHVIISAIMGIIIPIFWQNLLWLSITLLVLFTFENIAYCVACMLIIR